MSEVCKKAASVISQQHCCSSVLTWLHSWHLGNAVGSQAQKTNKQTYIIVVGMWGKLNISQKSAVPGRTLVELGWCSRKAVPVPPGCKFPGRLPQDLG